MPTLRHNIEYSDSEVEQVLYRLLKASHCHTCQDLADFFEVSLSVAKQGVKKIQSTGTVPDAWLVVLARMYNVHPEWVLTGCGPRFVTTNPEGHYPSPELAMAHRKEQEFLRSISLDALLYEVRRRAVMGSDERID